MANYRNKYILLVLFTALILTACKKQWDQRNKITDQKLNTTLMEQIKANNNLSTFASYLTKVGYDKLLTGTKTYTVWAPTNDALQGVTFSTDSAMKAFVNNHIANQTYLTSNIGLSTRVHALNGKNLTFTPTTIEDANIITADIYVNNGALNIIDKPLTPKLNISEYVRSLTDIGVAQSKYVISQDTSYIDTANAVVTGIDPVTGKPILQEGTGVVKLNKYFTKAGSLDQEDSTYTYFVLTDNAFNSEISKVTPYFATTSADTTKQLAMYNVLKDVVVRGKVLPADLSAVLKSKFGVTIPVSQANIQRTYTASNGIVYVMSSLNFQLAEKIPTITIQGERPSFYMRTDQVSSTNIRIKIDNNGKEFRDLLITPKVASFFVGYKVSNLNTCKYKVVYRAYNDTLLTHVPIPGNISEKIAFGPITGLVTAGGTITAPMVVNFPAFNVIPYNFGEVQALNATATAAANTINVDGGTLKVLKLNSINMYVQGANSTTANANDILVDYIKLIPILQ